MSDDINLFFKERNITILRHSGSSSCSSCRSSARLLKSLEFRPEIKDSVDVIDLIIQLCFSRELCTGKQARAEEEFFNLPSTEPANKTLLHDSGHLLTPVEGAVSGSVRQVVRVLLMAVLHTVLGLHHHGRTGLELEYSVGEPAWRTVNLMPRTVPRSFYDINLMP